MQLFWWDFDLGKGFSYDANIFHQIKNVLRSQHWDQFLIHDTKTNERFLVETTNLEKYFWFRILKKIDNIDQKNYVSVVIWMLNKFEKIEWAVQKLAEIWAAEIILFDFARSQIHEISEKKLERLNIIAREAVEQSQGWSLPYIHFENKKDYILKFFWKKYFLDFGWKNIFDIKNQNWWWKNLLVIWPEGWFSDFESMELLENWFEKLSLWENIFRAETASILWAYILKNL